MTRQVEVAIIGAGSAGLYALGQVRHHIDNYVIIDGGELGTTCARVGCMPSKVMIQVAEDFHRKSIFEREGIEGEESLSLNIEDAMEHVRDLRDTFVDRTLSHSLDTLDEDKLIESNARFVDAHTLQTDDGETIQAEKIIIATGTSPLIPADWQAFEDRILTSDTIFEQETLPESMAVIGLGVIGLELGQALCRMGIKVVGIDQLSRIGGIQDEEVNKAAIEIIGREMPLWLGAPAEVTQQEDGLLSVKAGDQQVVVEKLLVSIGRKPNLDSLELEKAGLTAGPNGVPPYNRNTMQTRVPHIFIAGDVTGERPVLHEAGFEGRVAGYNSLRSEPQAFRVKTPLNIVFCDPNIVNVGQTLNELDPRQVVIGEIRMAPVGRALVMGKNRGLIRVYADKTSGRILGASMVGVKGENLAHLLCWGIESGMTVQQALRMPFYHPVMEEALQAALYDVKGKLEWQPPEWPLELEPVEE